MGRAHPAPSTAAPGPAPGRFSRGQRRPRPASPGSSSSDNRSRACRAEVAGRAGVCGGRQRADPEHVGERPGQASKVSVRGGLRSAVQCAGANGGGGGSCLLLPLSSVLGAGGSGVVALDVRVQEVPSISEEGKCISPASESSALPCQASFRAARGTASAAGLPSPYVLEAVSGRGQGSSPSLPPRSDSAPSPFWPLLTAPVPCGLLDVQKDCGLPSSWNSTSHP